jgi:hypothetical protein
MRTAMNSFRRTCCDRHARFSSNKKTYFIVQFDDHERILVVHGGATQILESTSRQQGCCLVDYFLASLQ